MISWPMLTLIAIAAGLLAGIVGGVVGYMGMQSLFVTHADALWSFPCALMVATFPVGMILGMAAWLVVVTLGVARH